MKVFSYCLDCQRIFDSENGCEFCNSSRTKALKKGTSVNVIGTKSKGKILFLKDSTITVLINTEQNQKVVKDFEPKALKKIL